MNLPPDRILSLLISRPRHAMETTMTWMARSTKASLTPTAMHKPIASTPTMTTMVRPTPLKSRPDRIRSMPHRDQRSVMAPTTISMARSTKAFPTPTVTRKPIASTPMTTTTASAMQPKLQPAPIH